MLEKKIFILIKIERLDDEMYQNGDEKKLMM